VDVGFYERENVKEKVWSRSASPIVTGGNTHRVSIKQSVLYHRLLCKQ